MKGNKSNPSSLLCGLHVVDGIERGEWDNSLSASPAEPRPGTLVAPGSTLSPPGGGHPKTQDSGPLLTCLLCGGDVSPTWLPGHGAWFLGA